ncbi:hypothetical protein [Psychroserpens sp.]|uniref:hypothetical protein n=1 Tax=Psychroserpens sp. TaxID=2020870 RepID=UPI0038594D06
MKKIILLGFIICSMWSCSTGDDNAPDFYYETLPIESVNLPEEFQLGSTHQISMTYLRPSGCHLFNDFYFVSEGNQRTIAIINTVFPDQDCETFDYELEEVSFNFQVNSFEDYVFRFWQGEDNNGNDIYYIVEVPVVD